MHLTHPGGVEGLSSSRKHKKLLLIFIHKPVNSQVLFFSNKVYKFLFGE